MLNGNEINAFCKEFTERSNRKFSSDELRKSVDSKTIKKLIKYNDRKHIFHVDNLCKWKQFVL